MSANNEIYITKDFRIYDRDIGSDNYGLFIVKAGTLKDAIKRANKYMEENEVEYGLNIPD